MTRTQKTVLKKDDPRLTLIGKRLKAMRIEAGYSNYEDFAYEHGISRMMVYRAEKGTNITMLTLLRFLDIYEMSLVEFFELVYQTSE